MSFTPSSAAFHEAFGAPAIPAPAMQFAEVGLDSVMQDVIEENGAGWFLGSMFYLLGTGLDALAPCVRAWSFLLPGSLTDWEIVGYNRYGEILIMDKAGDQGTLSPVGVLSPLTATYFQHADLNIMSLVADWLPNRKLEHFLDTSVFRAFLESSGRLLEEHEILGIREPLSFGGEMKLDNFRPMPIVDYYEATAPVYEKAHAQTRK